MRSEDYFVRVAYTVSLSDCLHYLAQLSVSANCSQVGLCWSLGDPSAVQIVASIAKHAHTISEDYIAHSAYVCIDSSLPRSQIYVKDDWQTPEDLRFLNGPSRKWLSLCLHI